MKRFATLALCATFAIGTLLMGGSAIAAPSKQYKPVAYNGKDATFKGGKKVGAVLVTTAKPGKEAPKGEGKVTLAKGQAANFFGRAFFPGTLEEIATDFGKGTNDLKLTAYLEGAGGKPHILYHKKLTAKDKWQKWQWYTFTGQAKSVQKVISKLPAGSYPKAAIKFELTAGKSRMLLSASKLALTVQ